LAANLTSTSKTYRFRSGWGRFKTFLFLVSLLVFLSTTFLYMTPMGEEIRVKLAETVISTQHREWAWLLVGAAKRDEMVNQMNEKIDIWGKEPVNTGLIHVKKHNGPLVEVKDISGKGWQGKLMYVYDPTAIRVVTPSQRGSGETLSSMVKRTGAIGGVNGGGFNDPDGLGNGYSPIGFIMSKGQVIFTELEGHIPQHTVGFTDTGTLIVGKYSIVDLLKKHVSEAVSFYPRVIANGKPLITSGDGGWGKDPRTAVGQRADGTVIFVVIDGRQVHSIGATLRDVQDLLLNEGCVNAGFLDGGASSEMVYQGEILNKPATRYGERKLPSALLVFDNPNAYQSDRVWDGVTHIDPGGLKDHPELQGEKSSSKSKKNKN
jgi:exopolysaccharide biosynthesis protein